MKRIAKGKRAQITVGVHDTEGAATSGGATIADIAAFNEFGTERIPARSFIRAWADESIAENKRILSAIARNVVTGKATAEQGLDQAGLRFVGEIQNRISNGVQPPNAPSTIARKGSSTPLIDTGQLRSSIRHRVVK